MSGSAQAKDGYTRNVAAWRPKAATPCPAVGRRDAASIPPGRSTRLRVSQAIFRASEDRPGELSPDWPVCGHVQLLRHATNEQSAGDAD
jgi:hypothetical protein